MDRINLTTGGADGGTNGNPRFYQTTIDLALALAARVPIFPVFVVRVGRRRYRLVTARPIEITRSRNRDDDFARAVAQWMTELEDVVRGCWYQWFTFEPYWPEAAA